MLARELELQQTYEHASSAVKKYNVCHEWQVKRTCQYGDSCRYAHGEHELARNSACAAAGGYGTKYCREWQALGWCPFGAQCKFAYSHTFNAGGAGIPPSAYFPPRGSGPLGSLAAAYYPPAAAAYVARAEQPCAPDLDWEAPQTAFGMERRDNDTRCFYSSTRPHTHTHAHTYTRQQQQRTCARACVYSAVPWLFVRRPSELLVLTRLLEAPSCLLQPDKWPGRPDGWEAQQLESELLDHQERERIRREGQEQYEAYLRFQAQKAHQKQQQHMLQAQQACMRMQREPLLLQAQRARANVLGEHGGIPAGFGQAQAVQLVQSGEGLSDEASGALADAEQEERDKAARLHAEKQEAERMFMRKFLGGVFPLICPALSCLVLTCSAQPSYA